MYILFLTQMMMIFRIDTVFPVCYMIYYDLKSTSLIGGYPLETATRTTK